MSRDQGVVAVDFDGTIVDSMWSLRALAVITIQDTLDKVPPQSDIIDRYDRTAGETFRTQLNTILPGKKGRWSAADRDKVAEAYEIAKVHATVEAHVFEDVDSSLRRLARHANLWVVTSTQTRLVQGKLIDHDLWRRFHGCLGPEFGRKAKKLRLLQADYFIGDTDRDADHAREAGVEFLGICRDQRLLTSVNTFSGTLAEAVDHIIRESR